MPPGAFYSMTLISCGGFFAVLGGVEIHLAIYSFIRDFQHSYTIMMAPGKALLSWATGILLIIAGSLSATARRPAKFRLIQLLPFVLLFISGGFFRYFGLDYLPWGVEICATLSKFVTEDAFWLGENGLYPIWHPETGVFFLYYIHAGFELLGAGNDIYARILPAVGIAGAAAAALWAGGILKTRGALLLFTFAFTFSAIDSIMFASPYAYSHTNLWIISVLALLNPALMKGRTGFFIPAGLAFGLGPYTSLSFLPLFPIPLVFIAWSFAAGKRKTNRKSGLFLFVACSLLTASPFLATLAHDSTLVTGRIRRNTVDSHLARTEFSGNELGKSLKILSRSAAFYVTGDPALKDTNELDFLGKNTPLRPWMIPLLPFGIALALGRRRNGALLAVFLLAVSPVFICAANRIINGRLVTGLPALYLLAVLPVDELLARTGTIKTRWLAAVLSMLVVGGTLWDAAGYFNGMGIDRGVNHPLLLLATKLERRDRDEPVYFAFNPGSECRLNPGLVDKRCLEIDKRHEFMVKYHPLDSRADLNLCGGYLYYSSEMVRECVDDGLRPGESRFKLIFPSSDAGMGCITAFIDSLEDFAVPCDSSFIDISGTDPECSDIFPVIEMEILRLRPEG